jgi:hypothetical protein
MQIRPSYPHTALLKDILSWFIVQIYLFIFEMARALVVVE